MWTDSTDTVPGRYYRVRHDANGVPSVPAFPGPTALTSQRWWDKNFVIEQPPIGEALTTYQGWDNGAPPIMRPLPQTVGDPGCIQDGELFEQGLAFDDPARFRGWPKQCFVTSPLNDWGWVADVYNACVQSWWADRVIQLSDQNIGPLTGALLAKLPGSDVTFWSDQYLFPRCMTVVHPQYCVVQIAETQNAAQALVQVILGADPPTDMGGMSSCALWYVQAQICLIRLSLLGAGETTPILCVGYSYGGAAAMVAAAIVRLAHPSRVIRYLTFGAPRPGDERLQELLGLPTRGVALANNDDAITAIPPGLESIIPLQAVMGDQLRNWVKWKPSRETWTMLPTGQVLEDVYPRLSTQELIDLITHVVTTQSFYGYPAHNIRVYKARIQFRCPDEPAIPVGALGLRAGTSGVASLRIGQRFATVGLSAARSGVAGRLGDRGFNVAFGSVGLLSGLAVPYGRFGVRGGVTFSPLAMGSKTVFPGRGLGFGAFKVAPGYVGVKTAALGSGSLAMLAGTAARLGRIGMSTLLSGRGLALSYRHGGGLALRTLLREASRLNLQVVPISSGVTGLAAGTAHFTGHVGLGEFAPGESAGFGTRHVLPAGRVDLRGLRLAAARLGLSVVHVAGGLLGLAAGTAHVVPGLGLGGVRGAAGVGLRASDAIPKRQLGLSSPQLASGLVALLAPVPPAGAVGLAAGTAHVAPGLGLHVGIDLHGLALRDGLVTSGSLGLSLAFGGGLVGVEGEELASGALGLRLGQRPIGNLGVSGLAVHGSQVALRGIELAKGAIGMFGPVSPLAPPSFSNLATDNGITNSFVLSLPSPAGVEMLAIALQFDGGLPGTVAGTYNATPCTVDASQDMPAPTDGSVWLLHVPTAGMPGTLTVTWTNVVQAFISVTGLIGLALFAVDRTKTAKGSGGDPNSGFTSPLSSNSELALAAYWATGTPGTWSYGFTPSGLFQAGEQVLSSSSAIQAGLTGSTVTDWAIGVVTFK